MKIRFTKAGEAGYEKTKERMWDKGWIALKSAQDPTGSILTFWGKDGRLCISQVFVDTGAACYFVPGSPEDALKEQPR
jgi:hypothetical protein